MNRRRSSWAARRLQGPTKGGLPWPQYVPARYVPAQYVPAQYVPAQYVPAQYVPAQYVPAQYVPARVPSRRGAPLALALPFARRVGHSS